MEFMGIVTNVGDANTYFDYLNQAKDGHFLLRNSYTQEDTGYKMIRPLFWLMGVVPLPIMWSWHIFKIILIFGFVFVAQQFIRYFVQDDFLERIALVVMTFGTGLGWYVHMLNPLLPKSYGSIDLGLTEAFPFLSLHSAPHFIFSQILVMLAMYLLQGCG